MNKQELIKHFEDMPYVSISQMGKKSFVDLIEQLDEPQKVTIPQFVADWIDNMKGQGKTLYYGLDHTPPEEVDLWFCEDEVNRQNTFARAWLDGYEVEKGRRYLVKVKGVSPDYECLYFGEYSQTWRFVPKDISGDFRKHHTRKELEEAGFGEVFDSQLFEVEEVE